MGARGRVYPVAEKGPPGKCEGLKNTRTKCTEVEMRTTLAVLHLLAVLSLRAHAHGDEYFESQPAPHGGQVRMAGPVHLELVVRGTEVTVYVTDHADSPMNTDNGSAKVIIRSGRRNRFVVVLRPAGDN